MGTTPWGHVSLASPRQGDKEAELGLPFSPLCDRTSTLVAQSQIGELVVGPRPPPRSLRGQRGVPRDAVCLPLTAGFIDFIVEPTFSVLTDVAEKMVLPLAEDRTKAKGNPAASQQARSAAPPCLSFPSVCVCVWGTPAYFGTLEVAAVALPRSQLSLSPQLAVAAAVPG